MSVTLSSGKYIVSGSVALEVGNEVDSNYLDLVQNDCARNDIQRFLAHSERSSGQLRGKVVSLGYSAEVADTTVNWAVEFGLVDDLRFCELFISSRTMGRAKLKMELARRGVPLEVIEKSLLSVSERDSKKELVKQISSRYGAIQDNETARRRAFGWLTRRGFSSETVHCVLKEAL